MNSISTVCYQIKVNLKLKRYHYFTLVLIAEYDESNHTDFHIEFRILLEYLLNIKKSYSEGNGNSAVLISNDDSRGLSTNKNSQLIRNNINSHLIHIVN